MNTPELRAKFERAQRIIRHERNMRVRVFRDRPKLQAEKLAEMDELLALLVDMKDELKAHMEPEPEQAVLI